MHRNHICETENGLCGRGSVMSMSHEDKTWSMFNDLIKSKSAQEEEILISLHSHK